jgi:ureidoglycolate hydrolase
VACELVLDRNQKESEVNHLLLDFDDYDREEVMRKYSKIVEKENRVSNSGRLRRGDSMKGVVYSGSQSQRIRDIMEKKPMTSSITITALEDQHQLNTPSVSSAFPSPLDQH